MLIIKRYPNRKLYDTEAKRYIALEGIAEIIRAGKEVKVIDNITGDDLTALTLTQIIMSFRQGRNGILPNDFLMSLIRSSGDKIASMMENWRTPQIYARQLDDEIRLRIHRLVSVGELSQEEANTLIIKLTRQSPSMIQTDLIEEYVETYIASNMLPSKADLQNLSQRLETLEKHLTEIIPN